MFSIPMKTALQPAFATCGYAVAVGLRISSPDNGQEQ